MNAHPPHDAELDAVATQIRALDPHGIRIAQVIRYTLDQLYSGQRTGRYSWDQLYNTEKTHCSDLFEINLQREFKFENGIILNYQIAGIEVDCKYSQRMGDWLILPEAHGHLCLLVWAEDNKTPKWSMGLIRITRGYLYSGNKKKFKGTLNKVGRNSITWLIQNAALPPNVLLQLEHVTVKRIMSQTSGQKRINELFRSALGRRIGMAVIATVTRNGDYKIHNRASDRARTALQREGIAILGHYRSHCDIAKALGLDEPGFRELIPVRLVPSACFGIGVAEINGGLWRIAKDADPVIPAPDLPRI